MVAALTVSRHGPASRSAALRKTAARASQGISDQSRQAARAAATARATSLGPAWWQVASTWRWSCGATAFAVRPVRTSRPPMTSGISTASPSIASSRDLRVCLSGEPGR